MPNRLDTDSHIFFYENEFYVLSNYSAFQLRWKGITFMTSEHAYHWEKFPYRQIIRGGIISAPSAHLAQQIAINAKDLRRTDWDEVKVPIMKSILKEKYIQHDYVQKKLHETGDRELVEDSWRDDFWGWGPEHNGKNMMGKLWMQIREETKP